MGEVNTVLQQTLLHVIGSGHIGDLDALGDRIEGDIETAIRILGQRVISALDERGGNRIFRQIARSIKLTGTHREGGPINGLVGGTDILEDDIAPVLILGIHWNDPASHSGVLVNRAHLGHIPVVIAEGVGGAIGRELNVAGPIQCVCGKEVIEGDGAGGGTLGNVRLTHGLSGGAIIHQEDLLFVHGNIGGDFEGGRIAIGNGNTIRNRPVVTHVVRGEHVGHRVGSDFPVLGIGHCGIRGLEALHLIGEVTGHCLRDSEQR